MLRTAGDYRKYLDPQTLATVRGLDLRARLLVQGFLSGMHRSSRHGFSVEFAEHRKYCQGDDLRFLDWKVYGRTDKHYIKEHEQETNLRLLIAVDCSESMGYRSRWAALSKREYSTTVAAAIAYMALHQSDSVSVATFDTALRRITRPSNNPGHWKIVVEELEQAAGNGHTAFRSVLDALAEALAERHLVVLLSDCLGSATEILTGLKHLCHRRHEPIVIQVLDHAELTFPFERPVQFQGLEALGDVVADPRVIRERYLEHVGAFLRALRRGCHEQRVDHAVLNTSESLNAALSTYLAHRAARGRRWS